MEDLRYPIGKFIEQPFSDNLKKEWLLDISALPVQLEYAITNLDADQLETPYREGGWNIRQVVHHVADSHMNAYIRFKLGLTEDNPVIKPYEEQLWAEMADSKMPVNLSVTLLYALHKKWEEILNNISQEQFSKTVFHPQHQKKMSLWYLLGQYAWHGKHHTAHITSLRNRMNWN